MDKKAVAPDTFNICTKLQPCTPIQFKDIHTHAMLANYPLEDLKCMPYMIQFGYCKCTPSCTCPKNYLQISNICEKSDSGHYLHIYEEIVPMELSHCPGICWAMCMLAVSQAYIAETLHYNSTRKTLLNLIKYYA